MYRFLKHSISPVHIHRLPLLGAAGCVSLKWTQHSNGGYILEGKVHCKDLASVIITNVSPERTQGQRFCVTLDVCTIYYPILQKIYNFNTTFLHIVLLSLDRLLLSNLLHGLFLSVSPPADYKPVVQNCFFLDNHAFVIFCVENHSEVQFVEGQSGWSWMFCNTITHHNQGREMYFCWFFCATIDRK